jgi:hypothetical protein
MRISRRAICSSVVVRDCRRRGEVAPGSFCGVLLLFGGGCSGESCSEGIQIFAEKGISQRANCLVFALAVFEIRRAPQETSFFAPAVFFSRRAPRGCNCSAENPPPTGNPGLKRTRTDAILKKFEFKMNFKLKINVKWDSTNFRSIQ